MHGGIFGMDGLIVLDVGFVNKSVLVRLLYNSIKYKNHDKCVKNNIIGKMFEKLILSFFTGMF